MAGREVERAEGRRILAIPISKPRAQAVAESLRRLVIKERLVPGDKLPSEAELVGILGVSRSSVREGVQLLKSLGVIDVEHGRGMFLGSSPGRAIQQVIDWAYRPEDRARLLHDLVDARIIFEAAQARLAAERATDDELEKLIERFGRRTVSPQLDKLSWPAARSLGLDYHRYVARMAHNDILLIMANAVWPLYATLLGSVERTPAEVRRAIEPHFHITEALASRDGEEAAGAMTAHLLDLRSMLDGWIERASNVSRSTGNDHGGGAPDDIRVEPWKPRAEAVADALRALVMSERLVPGDKLPSEPELVEALEVGRSSVREGIQLLESLGIVDVEQGKGMFLGSNPNRAIEQVIDWAYPPEDRARLLEDLFDARLIVEGAQARLAAERATEAELAELTRVFGTREAPPEQLPWPSAQSIGVDYHNTIGRLAHNDVLLIMSNAVRPLTRVDMGGDPPVEQIARYVEHHLLITEAIERRDSEAAASAMSEHLRENRRLVVERDRPAG